MKNKLIKQLDSEYISLFCYRVGIMQAAGVGIDEAISIMRNDTDEHFYKNTLDMITESLEDGQPFSLALENTKLFPSHMLNMIKIGEVSGNLDTILHELYTFYKNESETQNFIKKAVIYPLGMAILISIIFLILLSQVLPIFDQVSSQMGVELSSFAKLLLGAGGAVRIFGYAIAIVILAISIATLFLVNTENGRKIVYEKLVKVLVGNKLTLSVSRSRFFSALATMLKSGLHIDESFEHGNALLEGTEFQQKISKCTELMDEGTSLVDAIKISNLIDGLEFGIVSAGARAGATEDAMVEVAKRYKEESDNLLESFLNKFELYMIIILCTSIGAVLLSVMLPLLGVLTKLGS